MLRKLAPEVRERRVGRLCASDQCTETEAVVVRFDLDLQALAGRIVHHVVEAAELRGIERCELAVAAAAPTKKAA